MKTHEEIASSISKYGMTLNSVALSVSLVALAGMDKTNSPIQLTSVTPFWCFFWGMIASGLYALLLQFASLGAEIISLKNDILATELDEKIKGNQLKRLEVVGKGFSPKAVSIYWHLQEILLWISFGLLVAGAYNLVCSIEIS